AQLLFGDDAITMGEEIDEHLEHFGAHVDRLPGALHLIALRVEGIVAKDVEHDCSPLDSLWIATGGKPGAPAHPVCIISGNTRQIPGEYQANRRKVASIPPDAAVLLCRSVGGTAQVSYLPSHQRKETAQYSDLPRRARQIGPG